MLNLLTDSRALLTIALALATFILAVPAQVKTTINTGVGEITVRYPVQDCGRNDFSLLTFVRGPEDDDCHVSNVWSKACVSYWTTRWTEKWWTDRGYESAAAAAALGLDIDGPVNILDEVYRALERGEISCP